MFDLLIKNGMILDGTGAPRFLGDVAVTGDRIVEVAPCIAGEAKRVIDAAGFFDLSPQLADASAHLFFRILVRLAVVSCAAAKTEDAQPVVDDELILNAVTTFGREFFIRGIVVPVNIHQRYACHRHKKGEVFCIQVAGGKDEIVFG